MKGCAGRRRGMRGEQRRARGGGTGHVFRCRVVVVSTRSVSV
jgi:hypothetical protein